MVTPRDITEWLNISQSRPPIHAQKNCERTTISRCRDACMRAVLNPCIDACLRLISKPAVNDLAIPTLFSHLFKNRNQFLIENINVAELDRMGVKIINTECINTCIPKWAKKWAEFIQVIFKRICIRVCTRECEKNNRPSCRFPCIRTPIDMIHTRKVAKCRVWKCLLNCITSCVRMCMKFCGKLVGKWMDRNAQHCCQTEFNQTFFRERHLENETIELRDQELVLTNNNVEETAESTAST